MSAAQRCAACGAEIGRTRDGLCPDCWYADEARPKPIRDRFEKLGRLERAGHAPYAYAFDRSHALPEALELWAEVEEAGEADEGPRVRIAGRILSYRDLGGSAFAHLGDRDGRLQIHLKR
ncbi:MAG TPA: hypothetical protein VKA44_06550, partial [Gemmatimonadota bacterium]|nr:hypothetical protein [Gemmatimonadota bacterium]